MTSPVILMAVAIALTGCTSSKPDVHEVGTCLRDPAYKTLSDSMGYWKLIVDKTETKYVICQAQAGNGDGDNRWYGCDVRHFTKYYNDPKNYTAVPCPGWPISDEVYSGLR